MSTPTLRALPPTPQELPESSLGVHDILFIVFKFKRIILACTLVGLIAAALVYFLYPPVFESQAKLLVRYFVERSAVDAVDTTSNSAGGSRNLAGPAIGAEVEILTSWDLAMQVAEALGPERLVGNPKASIAGAAGRVAKGLRVAAPTDGSVLLVAYQNRDPQLATRVLQELVSRYFVKHLEVHRSADAFDFVSQQTDQVRARLLQTEDALKPLKAQAGGMISLDDSKTALNAELTRTEQQLHAAETDFAEQQARVKELYESPSAASPAAPKAALEAEPAKPESSASSRPGKKVAKEKAASADTTPEAPPSGQVQQYQAVVTQLDTLRQAKLNLLSKYTARSVQVRLAETQIEDLESQRAELEKKYPELPATVRGTSSGSGRPALDLTTEKVGLAGLAAKVEALKARLVEVQAKVTQLNDIGPQIAELERKRALEEANYKYFQGTLEKTRIDEALDPSKIPNISAVQKPTPPRRVTTPRNKLALLLAGGGLGLGLGLALLFDLVLNRTIKRPLELEKQLHAPLLLSIPYTGKQARLQLPAHGDETAIEPYRNGNGSNGGAVVAPWSPGHFVRPYAEAIRDRLGLYFELNHLTHKPKLVGVSSFSSGAGTSTLAAGLASALSETDEGKVLLVDVNLGPGDVHPFFKGKPAYSLAAALQPKGAIDAAAENLYLATVGSGKNGPAQLGLKKFFDLMPNLKASDFDYIIFDMPPLEQTSPTWALSPFMDKMLLIVEGDTTNRDVVKRGYRKLVSERDNVAVVFNKAQSYGPKWIQGEN